MKGLKEPTLNSKLRSEVIPKLERVSLCDERLEQRQTTVQRSMSTHAENAENNPNASNQRHSTTTTDLLTHATARLSMEVYAQPTAAAEKPQQIPASSTCPPHNVASSNSTIASSGSAQLLDESLIVMPEKEVEIVSLTDDDEAAPPPASSAVAPPREAANLMMPPPAKPAPAARKPRTKKQAPVSIKSEKLSLAGGSTAVVAEPPEPVATRSTRSKKPKAVFPIPIQVAAAVKLELVVDEPASMTTIEPVVAAATLPPPVAGNTTLESVYEDARADGAVVSASSAAKETDHDEPIHQVPSLDPNATYINAATAACDATYVAPASVATANSNETFVADAAAPNETITLVAAAYGASSHRTPPTMAIMPRITPSMASIMTEDNSDTDEVVECASPPPRPPVATVIGSKYHKELFK